MGASPDLTIRQEGLQRALEMARRALAILEEQAAGYTALTMPAHLVIELEEQRKKVAELEALVRQRVNAAGDVPVAEPAATDVSISDYQRDLNDARMRGDRRLEGLLLSQLGAVYANRGDLPRAIEHDEQALAIARELGDRRAEAARLQNLGLALLRLADADPDQRQSHLARAARSLRQAIALYDALRVRPLRRARACYHLGRCYHQMGRWREAIPWLEQALKTFSRQRARPEWARTLLELGQLYHQYQDFESAYLYLKDALRLFRRIEDADGIAVAQEALGNLTLQTARPAEAIDFLERARRGYETLKRMERLRAVDDLLRVAYQAGQPLVGEGAIP